MFGLNWLKKKIRTIEDRRAYARGYQAGMKRGYEQGLAFARLRLLGKLEEMERRK